MQLTWINLLRKQLIQITHEQTCEEYENYVWGNLKFPLALQLGAQVRQQIKRQLKKI